MSGRYLTAYGIITAIAAAGFSWLWFSVLRHRLAARRARARRGLLDARRRHAPLLEVNNYPAPANAGSIIERTNLMPIGTVKFFNHDKGYCFIAPEDGGNDAFVHITAVEQAGMATLEKDQRVSFELAPDKRGKSSAVNLQSA